jgi:hypothetical protein
MRVNVYAEEMTDRVEIITKEVNGQKFTGVRFYLELPVTVPAAHRNSDGPDTVNVRGPFIHRTTAQGVDDDSSAVTFWGKRGLREVLRKALGLLDEHAQARVGEALDYDERDAALTALAELRERVEKTRGVT